MEEGEKREDRKHGEEERGKVSKHERMREKMKCVDREKRNKGGEKRKQERRTVSRKQE